MLAGMRASAVVVPTFMMRTEEEAATNSNTFPSCICTLNMQMSRDYIADLHCDWRNEIPQIPILFILSS